MNLAMPPRLEPENIVPPEWVALALVASGLTQADLARALPMTTTTVNRWVRGRQHVSQARWRAILSACGLPPDWRPEGRPKLRASH